MKETMERQIVALSDATEELGMLLDSNEELELAHATFQIKYRDFNSEEMPDEAYEEYMALEDIYARCNPPTCLNNARMEAMKETMQRYAKSHRE